MEWRRGRTQPRRLSRAPTAGLADGSALVLETRSQLPPNQARCTQGPASWKRRIQVHSSNIECILESLYQGDQGRGSGRCCCRGGPRWLTWPRRLCDFGNFRLSQGDQPKVKGAVATPAVPHPPRTQLSQLHDHITWEHRDRRFLKRRSAARAGSPLVRRAPLFQKAPKPAKSLPSRGVSSHHPSTDTPLETTHMKFVMEF
jgi:hypothetical protein